MEHASIRSPKPNMFKIKISKRLWIFQLGLFSPGRFNKKRCWSSHQTPVHWIIYMNMLDYFSPASSEVSRKRVSLFAKMLNSCFNLHHQLEEQRATLCTEAMRAFGVLCNNRLINIDQNNREDNDESMLRQILTPWYWTENIYCRKKKKGHWVSFSFQYV